MQEYAHDKDAIYLYQKPDDVFIDGRIEKHESHHMHNRALAKKACEAVLGTSKMSMIEDMMQTFQNLPYRQEKIAVWGHITVINDSTSTTPIALEVALRSHVDHPVILIMGGNSKSLPLHDLVLALKSPHIKNVYMMPGTLSDELSPHIHCHKEVDFEKLVQHAWKRCVELKEQCYLLFSPGATSFAQFKNEFDRGRRFTETISAIIKQCNAKDFI
jgi:UDP-N-acetylmuramoylalanine--D-glutamate ligase